MDAELLLHGTNLSDELAADLGDPRRTRRLQLLGGRMLEKPEASLPELFEDPAELEGAYRALRSPRLTVMKVAEAHIEHTVARCAQLREVLVVHDTTEFAFKTRDEGHVRKDLCPLSQSRQGFFAHLSLAVSADGLRVPLGIVGAFGYVHRKQVSPETNEFWDRMFGAYEKESDRWPNAIESAEKRLAGAASVIHVCDREADANHSLERLHEGGYRYVIRAFQGRKTTDGMIVDAVAQQRPDGVRRTIELSPRPLDRKLPKNSRAFPPRDGRSADVLIRACAARFPVGKKLLDIHVVDVVEENPPEGQERVHWVLLTSEKIETQADILRVVDIYRSRWLIEEYFKAIKTGCGYTDRQLDSAATLLVALGVTMVVAWQLLLLRYLSRRSEAVPATAALTPLQIRVLIALTPKLKWPDEPTLHDAMRGVARLGGHIKSNGEPGWQVLGRGFQKLLMHVHSAQLLAAGLVINP